MPIRKIALSWSSGKSAAYCLQVFRNHPELKVGGLMSLTHEKFDRVSLHGTRRDVVKAQAKSLNLPLTVVPLPDGCTWTTYRELMTKTYSSLKNEGFEGIAFGEHHLEDVRRSREKLLDGSGLTAYFPLWGQTSSSLAQEIVSSGIKAKIVCVNLEKLDVSFLGREFDSGFINALPKEIDPCGEHGEFYTCVYGGPLFLGKELKINMGEIVVKGSFAYKDLFLSQ
jgi:uncharacterized protein (TIGR00290 family)